MIQRDERRTPDIDLAILSEIAHRMDRKIDGAVDFAKPAAAVPSPCLVDDAEQFQRRIRRAARVIAVAERKLHPFIVDLVRNAKPFCLQATARNWRGGKTEWLGRQARAVEVINNVRRVRG
jgi:hypothetical protein